MKMNMDLRHWNVLLIKKGSHQKKKILVAFSISRLLKKGVKSLHKANKFLTLLTLQNLIGTFSTMLTRATKWIWQEEPCLNHRCSREWRRVWPKIRMAFSSKDWWKEEVSVKRSSRGSPKENPLMRRFFKGWPGKAKKTGFHIMFYFPTFLSKRWDMAWDHWQKLAYHKHPCWWQSLTKRVVQNMISNGEIKKYQALPIKETLDKNKELKRKCMSFIVFESKETKLLLR